MLLPYKKSVDAFDHFFGQKMIKCFKHKMEIFDFNLVTRFLMFLILSVMFEKVSRNTFNVNRRLKEK